MDISIRPFTTTDIKPIVAAFQQANWPKPIAIFETYYQEQINHARMVWVAYCDDVIAGYVTLKWQSLYKPFYEQSIPEIIDLNVLPDFRLQGIGTRLLEKAEQLAKTKSSTVGLGVGLYGGPDGGYGSAQRLYIKHGYIPDGRGVTYNYKPVQPGASCPVDDDLILWFCKQL
tara:strand:- start:1323 stop:1838 length:516 start_codon:yes stop_codon:yes gene_type:complete